MDLVSSTSYVLATYTVYTVKGLNPGVTVDRVVRVKA